jgi:predicted PurR-regulated permease PerM
VNTPDLLARHRVLRVIAILAAVILAIYAMQLIWSSLVTIGDIIVEFFLAWLIAFMLNPIVALLNKRGAPRPLAVSLVYLAVAVLLAGLIILIVPIMGDQMRRLAAELTNTVTPGNLAQLAPNLTLTLERLGMKPHDAQQLIEQLSQQVPTSASQITQNAVSIGANAIASVLTLLFDAFLVVIISFYMMLDGGRITAGLVRRLPPAWAADADLFRGYVSQIFGGFLRAQVTLSLIYGGLTWAMLALLGQANSFLVALVCGLIVILPLIGPFIALAPPVALVLLQTDPADLPLKLILLLAGLFVAQQITFQVIAPRIFSAHLGISPLMLIAALLIGAREGGIWGAFFGGPIVAVAYAMFEVFFQRFRRSSSLFPDAPEVEEAEGQSEMPLDGAPAALAPTMASAADPERAASV